VVPVSLSHPNSQAVTDDYATADDTARAGTDYVPVSGTLTFAAGETNKTFVVSVIGNVQFTGNRAVRLTLGNPSGAALGGAGAARLTILEDDATPNQRFVAQVYRDLLQRPVDPPSLDYFSRQLDQGRPRSQVVAVLTGSDEYRRAVVSGLYQTLLRRPADPAGRDNYVRLLAAGWSVEQVRASLIGSAEYFLNQGGGTNDGFLAAVYHDVLNRAASPGEVAAWKAVLEGGRSREFVAGLILNSREGLGVLIQGVYQRYLHRSANAGEVSAWVSYLQQGHRDEDMLDLVVGSDEYFARV
jgi:hypothetical protein